MGSDLHGAERAKAAFCEGRPALVWRRYIADVETPVSAALKLIEPGRGDFLLESVEGGETHGRHSLIGLNPDLVMEAQGNTARINRNWQNNRDDFADCSDGALDTLRALVAECHMDVPAELPSALACLVGYFGYETIGLAEKLPRAPASPITMPDMLFVRPTLIVVFDRLKDELFLVAPIWAEHSSDNASCDFDGMLPHIQERIDDCERRLAQAAPAQRAATSLDDIEPQAIIASEDYEAMVRSAQEYITAGDIFQVVLAQRFTTEFDLPPFDLYRALRRVNPSPFLYFLDLPGFAIVGSSPEILVRTRAGEVTIRPIAGTRPRGANAQEDTANRKSLLDDPKERAEHLMLLDLGRNDVGRVAQAQSVRVTDSYMVEFYSHVMHIVSNVTGALVPGKDAIDALFAGFPAGTVSGAPKIRACEIIAELEPETRGAYAGGVGYFSPNGDMDSCIVLRTGIVKDGKLHIQAGAGIVADSAPASEQAECVAKSGALMAAAREALRIAKEVRFGQ